MKDIKWISNFKIRLGWGTVGNDNIPNYLSLDLYEANKYGIGNSSVTVLNPKQLRNKNLKWEGSNTTNLGIDLGFFDNPHKFNMLNSLSRIQKTCYCHNHWHILQDLTHKCKT